MSNQTMETQTMSTQTSDFLGNTDREITVNRRSSINRVRVAPSPPVRSNNGLTVTSTSIGTDSSDNKISVENKEIEMKPTEGISLEKIFSKVEDSQEKAETVVGPSDNEFTNAESKIPEVVDYNLERELAEMRKELESFEPSKEGDIKL